jgi:hypothetical protein
MAQPVPKLATADSNKTRVRFPKLLMFLTPLSLLQNTKKPQNSIDDGKLCLENTVLVL